MQRLRPSGPEDQNLQVLLYLTEDKTLQLCAVLTVYRGSSFKADGEKQIRKLRVSKPSIHCLPPTSVSRVRVVQLTETSNLRFSACSLSQVLLIALDGCIVAEVIPESMQWTDGKVVIKLSAETRARMQEMQDKPDILFGKLQMLQPDAEEVMQADVSGGDKQVYTFMDFNRTMKGTKKHL